MTANLTAVYVGVAGRAEDFASVGAGTTVRAGDMNDYVVNTAAAGVIMFGQGGTDILVGSNSGTSGDVIFGDFGADDASNAGGGADFIRARSGDDVVFGGIGDDFIFSGSDDDYVDGGSGADIIWGGSEHDILLGGLGDDQIFGSEDLAFPAIALTSITTAFDGVTDAAGGGSRNILTVGPSTLTDFNDPAGDTILGGFGNDSIRGAAGADYIEGGPDDDQVFGNGGNDIIVGGTGSDNLRGNAGADVIVGDQANDIINGGSENDWLEGNDGFDVLVGGTGADRLDGGDGIDWLEGGAGYDLLIGGGGGDTFMFHASDVARDIWATVSDLGTVPCNFDGILLEGFGANLAYFQDGANALIYSAALGLVGGIIVQNITVAELQGHIGIFG